MTNTANGLRTVAAEMDATTTEMDKIQNMAAVGVAEQLNQILLRMDRMERNILQRPSRSCILLPPTRRVKLSTDSGMDQTGR